MVRVKYLNDVRTMEIIVLYLRGIYIYCERIV